MSRKDISLNCSVVEFENQMGEKVFSYTLHCCQFKTLVISREIIEVMQFRVPFAYI